MRQLQIFKLTRDFSGARLAEKELEPPKEDELQVKIKAVALNFPDILMCSGDYQFKPDLPFTPGLEASGEIIACGQKVKNWHVGDGVILGARQGLIAEKVNISSAQARAKPQKMDWCQAAAFRVAWQTAYVALVERGAIKKGETILILGAAGGVGLAAIHVAKKMGAFVFAATSSEEKGQLAKKNGADVILASDDNMVQTIKRATHDKGVDIVYDPVGGRAFDLALRCLGWQGRYLVIGFASGQRPQLAVNYALIKGLSIIGVRAGEFARQNPQKGREIEAKLEKWAQSGEIKPHIGAVFPFEQSIKALQHLAQRRALGKICITMNDENDGD